MYQVSTSRQGESDVSQNGSNSLELRVNVVQWSSTEWRTSRLSDERLVWVLSCQSGDVCHSVGVGFEVACKVIDQLLVGGDVSLYQREEGACQSCIVSKNSVEVCIP